jgi:tetratricopeptide (TPR) repeat protein
MRIPALIAGALLICLISAALWFAASDREPDNAKLDREAVQGHAHIQKLRESGDNSDYARAAALFDGVLAANPDHVKALIGKASLAMWRHDFQTARQIAGRAAALDGYSAEARGILADALIDLGLHDAAIPVLDEMVRLKPNLSSYSRISYMRQLKGDSEGAIQAMEMAIQAGAPNAENTAWCIVQLGHLYLGSGRAAEARMAYEAALKRFPNYIHARAGLRALP